jgi:hypothetical protein
VPLTCAATAPTKNGPITRPSGRPRFSNANIRVRTPIGYWSAMSDGEIGILAAAPKPAPARAKPMVSGLTTRPVRTMHADQMSVATARIFVRK